MRPFASSYRALVHDLGRPLVMGLALVATALVVYALVDLRASRDAYSGSRGVPRAPRDRGARALARRRNAGACRANVLRRWLGVRLRRDSRYRR
ncbi:MAG: hypothetical protein U0235_30280 [Polyangiaceae bacterium]